MTVPAGYPVLQVTHAQPLRAVARPARGRGAGMATLLAVVEDASLVRVAGVNLTARLTLGTGPTQAGPVVVRYTTEDDQALTLLASNMVAGVVPAEQIDRALEAYLAAGPAGVLLVACCFQLWPQLAGVRGLS